MKITLIHNPAAGNEDQPSGEELTRLIESAGHGVRYQSCKRADWREALCERADLVAIAGGDGIVGTTLAELVGRKIPATILPMGTANNIASALSLRGRDLEQLIRGWENSRRVRFDVAVAKGPWGSTCFVEGMGIGAFTETMSRLDARKNVDLAHHENTDKKIESVLHIMKIRLEGAALLPLKLRLDDVEVTGEFVLLEAMNIPSIGPNLELAPDADPSDGTLDVVLVSDDQKTRLSEYLARRIAGKKEHPRLDTHRVRHMRIECDETRVHIDDEVWPEHGEHPPFAPMIIEVAMHAEKLEILIPA
jgi:diacylglycerol kinase family enzyme